MDGTQSAGRPDLLLQRGDPAKCLGEAGRDEDSGREASFAVPVEGIRLRQRKGLLPQYSHKRVGLDYSAGKIKINKD